MNEESWEVERLWGHCYIGQKLHYLVAWTGLPLQDSCEPVSNLQCDELLTEYQSSIGHTPPDFSSSGRCTGCGCFTAVTNRPPGSL